MKVEGQQPYGRPYQPETDNLPQTASGRTCNRDVESRSSLDSLLYILAEFLEDVALEFKPISNYLCKVLTLENFMKAANNLRHEAEQASIDVKMKSTNSKFKHFQLKASKEMKEFRHDVKNRWSELRDDFKTGWKKLSK
ncbi:hypothetical protein [Endozoicomonas sp. 8E]|uniref:hypothetical protein n=1 Tax=Endozoicomonas sp. 8E TaxID=3035692 RepID=UPI002938DAC3|nr:hypothetical protein [Endozoicomonas sp. 8E]WOG25389.1 hypothetical protein P6910_12380 [Endozoicomonas sp. 8E]